MTPPGEQEVIIRAKNGKNDRREKKTGNYQRKKQETTREKTGQKKSDG